MRLFNRMAVTLLFLALAAGAITVIVLAWTMPEESIRGLRDAVDWLDDNNADTQKVVLTSAGALIALIAVTVLVMEFAPSNGAEVKVTDVNTGNATLTTTAIGQRIEEAVRTVPNIVEVRAAVRARRKGILVSLELHVDPNANLAAVAEAACEATRQVLAERVHVELAEQPKVRLHYRELRLHRLGRAPSSAPAPAASAPGPAQPSSEPVAESALPEPAASGSEPAGEKAVTAVKEGPPASESGTRQNGA